MSRVWMARSVTVIGCFLGIALGSTASGGGQADVLTVEGALMALVSLVSAFLLTSNAMGLFRYRVGLALQYASVPVFAYAIGRVVLVFGLVRHRASLEPSAAEIWAQEAIERGIQGSALALGLLLFGMWQSGQLRRTRRFGGRSGGPSLGPPI